MTVKEILNQHIKDNKISLYWISKKTGIRYELLRRAINGNRVLPADELVRIAIVLDFDLNLFKQHIEITE